MTPLPKVAFPLFLTRNFFEIGNNTRSTLHAPSPEIDAIVVMAEPVVDPEAFEFAVKTPLDVQIYSMSVSFKCCCFDGRILVVNAARDHRERSRSED